MQLFYTPDITLPLYRLGEQESAHCVRVLRMGEGHTVHLTDGRGSLFQGIIRQACASGCTVEIVSCRQECGRRPYRLTIGVAPTKNHDRIEWLVEKATEIGIDRIVPLVCERSQRRSVNLPRLQRVAVSAMKQSLKTFLPEICEPTPVRQAIAAAGGTRLIAHCTEDGQRTYICDALQNSDDIFILIGPEGDFSPEEITFARENGFTEVSLGEQRMRTETAALFACSAAALANMKR